MNDLVPTSGGAPANPAAAKAEKIKATLQRVRQQYLAPFDAWDVAVKEGQRDRDALFDGRVFLYPKFEEPWHPKSEEDRDQVLRQLDRSMIGQPSMMTVTTLRSKLDGIATEKPNSRMNRVLAGLMVGSFPNARPYSPDTYLEALIDALEQSGLLVAVVAKACNQVTTTCKFPPTVSEVVEAAEGVSTGLSNKLFMLDRYAEKFEYAGLVRAWIKAVPLLASDGSNRERPPQEPRLSPAKHRPEAYGRQSWC